MARHIKSGDTVIVIAGADKGKTGRVLRILTDKDRVVVEGDQPRVETRAADQRNPQGGRIQKDAPIHLSNVMPLDPTTGKGTRVKFEERRRPQAPHRGRQRHRPGPDRQEVTPQRRRSATRAAAAEATSHGRRQRQKEEGQKSQKGGKPSAEEIAARRRPRRRPPRPRPAGRGRRRPRSRRPRRRA